MAHSESVHIQKAGPLTDAGGLNTIFMVFAAVGVAAFAAALKMDPTRAWTSFVINHFYFMGIALCAIFFSAIHWLTSSMWSSPVRRLMEATGAYLPFTLVTTAVLYFGIHTLYVWSHPEIVAASQALQGKAGYLSVPFFMSRNLIGLGILIFLMFKLVGNSLAQDKDPSMTWTRKNKALSPGFIILFALIFTMASFDEIMSLDPGFYSTMFGVYLFSGSFYAQIALTALITLHFRGHGKLGNVVNDNHLHDLGKYMFGMTVFYAYIGFSQFMLIWYANIPEETGWFINRIHGPWLCVSVFLIVGKFAVPFFALLPRGAKRCTTTLTWVGLFMMAAHWIDVMWMVQPNFFHDGPKFGWIEFGVTAGFIGAFGLLVIKFLSRNNMVAAGDPRLEEAAFHHHQ